MAASSIKVRIAAVRAALEPRAAELAPLEDEIKEVEAHIFDIVSRDAYDKEALSETQQDMADMTNRAAALKQEMRDYRKQLRQLQHESMKAEPAAEQQAPLPNPLTADAGALVPSPVRTGGAEGSMDTRAAEVIGAAALEHGAAAAGDLGTISPVLGHGQGLGAGDQTIRTASDNLDGNAAGVLTLATPVSDGKPPPPGESAAGLH